MNRHTSITPTRSLLRGLLQTTGAVVLLMAWSTLPAAAQTTNAARQKPSGPDRWECGVETRCVGNARAELAPNGMAQLRLVDTQSNALAYLNVYWTSIGPPNSLNLRELTVTVGIGTPGCELTADVGFYVNGRIETFLGGVGTGPKVPAMQYRRVTRQFYIPDGATITVGPGAAYCSSR